jgi:uncharacterized protein (TIGR00251 family)
VNRPAGDLSTLPVVQGAEGVEFGVRAAPGASRECVVGRHGDAVKVAVQAPPQEGKANERLLAVLAAALGVQKRQLMLVSGARGRDKRVRVLGLAADVVLRRLAALQDS